MARGRPFGVFPYSFGLYSRWYQVAIEPLTLIGRGGTTRPELQLPVLHLVGAELIGQSCVDPSIALDAVLALSGAMGARGGVYAPLRYYWEHEPPSACGDDWLPAAPCVAAWAPIAGCDATWAVQPKPPFACPEVAHG